MNKPDFFVVALVYLIFCMDGIRAFDEQKKEKCVSIVRFVKASYVRANKKTHTQK